MNNFSDHGIRPSGFSNIVFIPLVIMLSVLMCFVCSLNIALWFYIKSSKSPSVIFIKAILIASSPAVVLGCPTLILLLGTKFNFATFEVCSNLQSLCTITFIASSMTIQYLFASMALQRYLYIVKKEFYHKTNSHIVWFGIPLSLALITNTIMTFEIATYYPTKELLSGCSVVHFEITQNVCKDNIKCIALKTVIIVTFTQFLSNTVLGQSTTYLKRHIVVHGKQTAKLLGRERITNTKRLKATHLIWIAFSVVWIPWGITRITYSFIQDPFVLITVNNVCHSISYFCFLSIPLVYLKMDKDFSIYLQRLIICKITNRINSRINSSDVS